ncbi:MAG TPA: hypothetical protein VF862_12120 [Gemmatimonadales bacterium]
MRVVLRRLRGALGTALAWSAAWFGFGFLFITAVNLFDLTAFRQYADFTLATALGYALSMAAVGFVTGGLFSLYVAAGFGGRQLRDLRPMRLALGGSVVAVLVSLGMLGIGVVQEGYQGLRLMSLLWPTLLPAVLGGATSYGSVKLAQRALPASGGAVGQIHSGTG